MVIADTGYWVALLSREDKNHALAQAASLRFEDEGFITTHAVIAEACHMLAQWSRPERAYGFLEILAENEVEIFEIANDALLPMARLMRKYKNLPMDYADATLILLAEELKHGRILTTDRRDFGTYRWKNHYPFESLLEESV